jgi:16S rRNA (guanine1207-N2)-methyltransferase
MARQKPVRSLSQAAVPEFVVSKARPPLAVVLGSPAEVVNLLAALPGVETTCFQLDLHQSAKLQGLLGAAGLTASVVTLPDLWDLPADFQTALYLPARGGERELKIDMVDQAFHVLRPGGTFLVWSPYERDPFFQGQLKKVFGRAHTPPHRPGADVSSVLWAPREGDRPRRRHEVTFQVRVSETESCRFVSRPGTFSYGRFDLGARALVEVAQVEPGDRVVDLGCGVGTNGVLAARRAGASGFIAFVDSNVRALALAEHNARANGLANFRCYATATVEGPEEDSFDVVMANPPYFANSTIARLFIERSKKLLTPQGKLYLVTKQPDELAALLIETFGNAEGVVNRGYTVLIA